MQPLSHGQRVHVFGRGEAEGEGETVAFANPLRDRLARLALEDPEVLLQHLEEGPVRDSLAVREATAGPEQRLRRFGAQPLPELADEPRLADAGIADDRDQLRLATSGHPAVCVLQLCQLAVATDEGRPQSADAARAHQRQGAHELAALNTARLSLRVDRPRLSEFECAADGRDCPFADEDLARAGGLLQPRADVDGVAGHERAALTGPPDDDAAGVDPDAKGETIAEQLREAPLHRERDMERALGVVFVRRRSAERSHHRVTDELLDRAARPLDLGRHRQILSLTGRRANSKPVGSTLYRRQFRLATARGHDRHGGRGPTTACARARRPRSRKTFGRASGASRTRTGGLLGAIQALSQLSYSPARGTV